MKKELKKSYQLRYLGDRNAARIILKGNMDKIVKNILKAMNEKKFTQTELAYCIDSDQRHISYILRSGKGITINVAGRIAYALDTTLSELVK